MRAQPNVQTAPGRGAAAKGTDNHEDPIRTKINLDEQALLHELKAARARFERGLMLLERADELREMLTLGIDEDLATAAVTEFKRDCAAYKRRAA